MATPNPLPNEKAKPTQSLSNATVESVAKDQSSIRVRLLRDNHTLVAKAPEAKAAVGTVGVGDVVNVEYEEEGNVLREVSVAVQEVHPVVRLLTLAGTAAGLLAIFWLLLRPRLVDLIVGTDNRYSKSKFQMALWFFILLVSYVSLALLRGCLSGMPYFGTISIPQNLLLLTGVSAFSFAAAKGLIQSRVDAATRPPLGTATEKVESKVAATERKEVTVRADADPVTVAKIVGAREPRFPHDLFHDDQGRVDVGDFQLVVLTLLAVVTYVATIFNFLGTIESRKLVTLPDIDGTILAAFGLGTGAYLAKKLVGDAGGGRPAP